MTKKIGIITYQRAHNYGAILQCLALQTFLNDSYNIETKVIDYRPNFMDYYHFFSWKRFSPLHPIRAAKELLFIMRRYKRYQAFHRFIESKLLLDKVYSSKLAEYNTIVVGSDQLWNINNTNGIFDPMYWGAFKNFGKPKLITYAVSMGGCTNIDWNHVKDYIVNFDAISVRELYLKENLSRYAGCQSKWVLDPTLLQPREFWLKITSEHMPKKPYLFYYQARNKPKAFEYARETAKRMNLEFIYCSAHIMLPNSKEMVNADPINFLNYLRNAAYVITSSFHGTVFCVQFHKFFSSLLLNDGDDGRSKSLLCSIGLEDHLLPLTEPAKILNTDWTIIDVALDKQRKDSKDWLLNNL